MSERHGFSDHDSDGGRASVECGRGTELVAHLYGEASPAEGRLFAAHLKTCAACRAEVAAFRVVRAGLIDWREEVVTAAPPVAMASGLLPAHGAGARAARERSALAALREFLSLSPLWLKAGGAFAAVAVCALAALALARAEVRWDERGFALNLSGNVRPIEKTIEVRAPGTYTEQQLNEIADARVRAALEEQLVQIRSRQPSIIAAPREAATDDVVNLPVKVERPTRRNRPALVKRDHTVGPRDEFVPEDNLPGLYDLLRAAN
jgi:anti-sigma factor RsiW